MRVPRERNFISDAMTAQLGHFSLSPTVPTVVSTDGKRKKIATRKIR
jgi:hypothetical protein